jgi:hypothetical protein
VAPQITRAFEVDVVGDAVPVFRQMLHEVAHKRRRESRAVRWELRSEFR